jgi:Fanconi anemia group M protein
MVEKILYIDNRERSGLEAAVKEKADKAGIKWEVNQNLITDYCYGQLGIEAKTIDDYMQSLQSGHLAHQLENMDENYNRNILVIHGKLDAYVARLKRRGNRTPFARIQAQFLGSLARLDVDFDLTVMQFPTPSAAAYWIVKRCEKDGTLGSISTYRTLRRTSSEDMRIDALRGLGCSEAIAKRLLKSFGSITEIAGASANELMKLEGIGKVRAKGIVEALNSESPVVKERIKITNA